MRLKNTLLIASLLLATNCFAAVNDRTTVIPTMAEESLPALNNILVQDNRRLQILEQTDLTLATSLAAYFNLTTGHDHDGSDSKKVLATNIDTTGLSAGTGYYVYNNSGTLATTPITTPALTLVDFDTVTGGTSITLTGMVSGGSYFLVITAGEPVSTGYSVNLNLGGAGSNGVSSGWSFGGAGNRDIYFSSGTTEVVSATESFFMADLWIRPIQGDTTYIMVSGQVMYANATPGLIPGMATLNLDAAPSTVTITFSRALTGSASLYKLSES